MTSDVPGSPRPADGLPGSPRPADDVPPYDRLLDERGTRCPMPVVNLARMTNADPTRRLLLLADDPAAETDVPAWCALRHRVLAWTGPAPDGRGRAYLVVPPPPAV